MNVAKIVGWILTALLAALFLFSGAMKFSKVEGEMAEGLKKMGIEPELLPKIGVLEISCVVLFVVPHTGFIGAILLTGYLGGAIMTHIRIGDVVYTHVVIGVLVWVALGLRQPEIFQLALGLPVTGQPADEPKPLS